MRNCARFGRPTNRCCARRTRSSIGSSTISPIPVTPSCSPINSGCILRVAGDASVRRRLERIDFIPGGNWSEIGCRHQCDRNCARRSPARPTHGCRTFLRRLDRSHMHRRADPRSVHGRSHRGARHHRRLPPHPLVPHELARHQRTGDRRTTYASSAPGAPAGRRFPPFPPACRSLRSSRSPSDAMLLTLAGGTMSASLDLDVTLRTVAEQTAALLHVERAAVCLFGDGGAKGRYAPPWSIDAPGYELNALLAQARDRGCLARARRTDHRRRRSRDAALVGRATRSGRRAFRGVAAAFDGARNRRLRRSTAANRRALALRGPAPCVRAHAASRNGDRKRAAVRCAASAQPARRSDQRDRWAAG